MNQATNETLRVNDIDLHVESSGVGAPLLLLHGFTGSSKDWLYAGRDLLAAHFRIIAVDLRGHGRTTNPAHTLTHRQCALDVLALLDRLRIDRCKAIGMSFGGNVLLHVATRRTESIEAMVIVSSTPYFPEQARKIMGAVPPEAQPAEAWEAMRGRHELGDEQIRALFQHQYAFKDSYEDMSFTPPELSRIRSRTLIVQGDRDPLYPVELSVEMYRAIPNAELAIVPNAGHGPIFVQHAETFARSAIEFLGRA